MIEKIAGLAKLPIDKGMESQFKEIINFVKKINSLEISGINPTFQVTRKKNEFRRDKVTKSLTTKEAVKNANQKKDGYFLTRGILDV